MSELFLEYRDIVVFLHLLGAVIWVGGMVAIRFVAHSAIVQIESPKVRLDTTLLTLKNLFNMVLPFVAIIFLSAVILALIYGGHNGSYSTLFYAKEAIWSIMAINFFLMRAKRNKAQKELENGKIPKASKSLATIGKYMVPLNISLGLVALFIGVVLSGVY